MLDLLIQNASILDGTGADAFEASIGIQNGKIVFIGHSLPPALHTIDASGLTVSPGWIDSHSHSDRTILSHPDQREKVEQGITFSITGQCGGSPAPLNTKEGMETVGDYLKKAAGVPQGSGAALLVGHNTLRRAVMGSENRAPSAAELERMCALLHEGLQSGAIGLSYGLYYTPGCYAKPEETVALAKVVAEHGGLLTAHIRNESNTLLEAVDEFLSIVRSSGCRGVFSHHKSCMRENWGKVHQTIPMIDRAISEGLDLYLDVYPYCATSTSLLARFVPVQFHPPGTTDAVRLLDDPGICDAIKAWGLQNWQNDLSWTLIVGCPGHPEYIGKNLNEIADLRGQANRMDAALDLIRDCGAAASAAFFSICEDDLSYVIRHPRAMICTDSGVAADMPAWHPRLRAAFPCAIRKYVREEQQISLPEMIRKMTSLPAHVYGLKNKGRIAEGMDADLCIFDAGAIADRADYQHFSAANEGLHYVLIDGRIVLENNRYNQIRAAKLFLR